MILKGSQRSGGKQLGAHLLKTEENEHVEVHEVTGFIAETVQGAMMEAYALSKGTKCKQYLFSVSLNPPAGLAVDVEVFEKAIAQIEKQTGLEGQPRIIVFHEKEGRRHGHAVWSRIDTETMTAKPLPFFKGKLNDLAMQLFLDNGWELPKGFIDKALRDPRSFSLDEWQQSKRSGLDARLLKAAVQESWRGSDNAASFAHALEERGLSLAQGDRRGHVIVTMEGDIYPVARLAGETSKTVRQRLGDPNILPSVATTLLRLSGEMVGVVRGHITEAKRIAANAMKPLMEQRTAMTEGHKIERRRLATAQQARQIEEQRQRASRIRHGVAGVWDILTGRYAKARRRNEAEAISAIRRDAAQRNALVREQMQERSALQQSILHARERHARQVLALYRDAAVFRRMRGEQEAERNRPELGR